MPEFFSIRNRFAAWRGRFRSLAWRRRWRGGRLLFLRFAVIFGFFGTLIVGGIAGAAYLGRQFMSGMGMMHLMMTPAIVWLMGLTALLPLLAVMLGGWARRRIANPLAEIMDAADAVSQGDLSVRVKENNFGEFQALSQSFNRMVAEIERTNQLRRNLAADVAHELNTPLHIIQGTLEAILDGLYQPDAETIQSLLDETHLLSRLVDDLRTLSLAEAGQLPLKIETVSSADLLSDIRTSFSGQAETAGIHLDIQIFPALQIKCDPNRLNQVLSNLTANALRYTPKGGYIKILAVKDGNFHQITVRDNGSGIKAEDLPFVFDRFWRGDRSRSRTDGSGHGLGLAIAKQLVQAHGGTLGVESEVGAGTIFTIRLPIHQT